MSNTNSTSAAEQPENLEDYAPLSGMAITAFLLSLATPIARLIPALAFFAIVPAFLGLIASLRIRRSSTGTKGRSLALAGIAIALFFMAASLVGNTMSRRHISSQAQLHFEEWLDYIKQGKLFEAHELHRQYTNRQLPGTNLEAVYTKVLRPDGPSEDVAEMMQMMQTVEFSPKEEFDFFYSTLPIPTIVEHANDATFQFLRLEEIEFDRPDTEISLRYRMEYRDGGVVRNLEFIVIMIRSRYEGGEYHWVMFDVKQPGRSI